MIPVLETPRLRLRPPAANDLEPIYQLGKSSKVMRYITNGRTLDRTAAKADLEKRISASKSVLGYWITELKETGEVIGWTALKPLDNTSEIEIGYRYLEAYWGKGYATEASRRLLHYGFQELKLDKIVSIALKINRASTRVMEKIGLSYQKKARFYGHKCVYYTLLRADYLSKIAKVNEPSSQ